MINNRIKSEEVREMKVARKIHPGTFGSVRELRQYGERLVAVRYRKDGKGGFAKTVEIVVACERRC